MVSVAFSAEATCCLYESNSLAALAALTAASFPAAFSSCEIEETGTGVNSTVEEGWASPDRIGRRSN